MNPQGYRSLYGGFMKRARELGPNIGIGDLTTTSPNAVLKLEETGLVGTEIESLKIKLKAAALRQENSNMEEVQE
jgi:hypothetical protein